MATNYYLVSDLHIGGDEQLRHCEFEAEFLEFLRDLESRYRDPVEGESAELVVLGDAFGLWEFTDVDGVEKFEVLTESYPRLFEQFRATGEHVTITLIPGNHDYELACYPEYVERLAAYHVTLEQELHLLRDLDGRRIWIEHGMQQDPNNRIPDFGNPYANPPGYFVNRHVTSTAGRLSDRGRYNWLKDIQSVQPMTEIPRWMASNYYYREMSPFLRYASVPFLVTFYVSLLVLVSDVAATVTGIRALELETYLTALGVVGDAVNVVIGINILFVLLSLVFAVPLFFFGRDVRRTLRRFRFVPDEEEELVEDEGPDRRYLDAASEVFEDRPDVVAFVYGHTHRASLTELDGRYVLNTGTWLKILRRVKTPFTPFPSVYRPSYRLNYFHLHDADGELTIDYHTVEKANPRELSWLERLFSVRATSPEAIPDRTVVDGAVGVEPTPAETD
ncbi:metallophosphoesterase [Halomarina oriensis]|uniref:Phosphoesterase n=1 Tax=Halomarina oriensis TaxID=671145 RepID=A0A6B0GLJ1_9EURY|nr:metallophosphoesterase [Halomarina oriensis]MWG33653.1 phosphoesterase [Halomarina oriensis]